MKKLFRVFLGLIVMTSYIFPGLHPLILKRKQLFYRYIDSVAVANDISRLSCSPDRHQQSLSFLFENQMPLSVKAQAGYLGLFAGISPPAV